VGKGTLFNFANPEVLLQRTKKSYRGRRNVRAGSTIQGSISIKEKRKRGNETRPFVDCKGGVKSNTIA